MLRGTPRPEQSRYSQRGLVVPNTRDVPLHGPPRTPGAPVSLDQPLGHLPGQPRDGRPASLQVDCSPGLSSAGNRRASPRLRKGSCLFLGRHGVLVEPARDPEPPRPGLPPSSSAPLLALPSNRFCPLWRGGPQHPLRRSTVLLCPRVPAEPWEQPLPHPHVYCLCGRYMVELSLWVCLLARPASKASSLS